MPAPLHIILYQPEIPQNAGAILRTCAAVGAELHLIGPLGFRLDSAGVRRAGMDYREWTTVQRWNDWTAFRNALPNNARLIAATTKTQQRHADFCFAPNDWLLFGPEGSGLPVHILSDPTIHTIRIPMLPQVRSLNLAQSVAVILYEALRHSDFADLV